MRISDLFCKRIICITEIMYTAKWYICDKTLRSQYQAVLHRTIYHYNFLSRTTRELGTILFDLSCTRKKRIKSGVAVRYYINNMKIFTGTSRLAEMVCGIVRGLLVTSTTSVVLREGMTRNEENDLIF